MLIVNFLLKIFACYFEKLPYCGILHIYIYIYIYILGMMKDRLLLLEYY